MVICGCGRGVADHLLHIQAISEKSEMAREIPRLRGILASKSKRIGQLEQMIGETKEIASVEYEKLHSELEQVKHDFTAKLKEKERESESLGSHLGPAPGELGRALSPWGAS